MLQATGSSAALARGRASPERRLQEHSKVLVEGGRVTRVSREIDTERAHGEYIGVAKFTAAGAARLLAHYHRCRERYAGKPFHQARLFEKAYLIQLFQDMIEAGERFAHVDTPGEYIEIDTQQDFDYARRHWMKP